MTNAIFAGLTYDGTMLIIELIGWAYLVWLGACISLATVLRRARWIILVVLAAASAPVAYVFFGSLSMHVGQSNLFDLAIGWAQSYPVEGFGAVIFVSWPAWLVVGVLAVGWATKATAAAQADLLREGDRLAAMADSALNR